MDEKAGGVSPAYFVSSFMDQGAFACWAAKAALCSLIAASCARRAASRPASSSFESRSDISRCSTIIIRTACMCARTHVHARAHMHSLAHSLNNPTTTCKVTHIHACMRLVSPNAHMQPLTHARTHSLTHTQTLTLARTCACTCTGAHLDTHLHACAHLITHMHKHAHALGQNWPTVGKTISQPPTCLGTIRPGFISLFPHIENHGSAITLIQRVCYR